MFLLWRLRKTMKFVAIIFVLALFVGGNEAWLRRRRRRTPTSCRPRNCQLSAWSQWSSCPCGASGTRNRTRRIIWPATCGGTCFFHRSEMQFCKRDCQNSGIPTRNGCLCPHGFLGACCEIGKLNLKKNCKLFTQGGSNSCTLWYSARKQLLNIVNGRVWIDCSLQNLSGS